MSVETVDFVLNPLLLSLEAVNLAGDLVSLVISFLFLPLFGSSLIIKQSQTKVSRGNCFIFESILPVLLLF